MKKGFIIVVAIISFWLSPVLALDVDIKSDNMVLYNLNDNKIIAEKNKDEQVAIASMTKIMTTLVAIEHIDNLDEKVTLNYKVFEGLKEANASVAGFRIGQTVTYRDLLYGALLPSGADAAKALSLYLAGSEEKFVAWMNERAHSLNLKKTNFVNTTGLDTDGHHSTVNEVAIILKEAFNNPEFRKIFEADRYVTSDKSLTLYSTLGTTLRRYNLKADYIIGAKTGYTGNAGRCLASIAYDSKQNIYYLMITTKAQAVPNHITDAINTYSYYLKNYGYKKLIAKDDELTTLATKNSKEKKLLIKAEEDIFMYLRNDYDPNLLKVNYEGLDKVSAFTKVGTKLGTITVLYNDELVTTFSVHLNDKVPFSLLNFILNNILWFIIGIIILLLFAMIIRKRIIIKRKKRRIKRKVVTRQ